MIGFPWARALLGGLAGAVTLNLIHESVRRLRPDAPRIDPLCRRAIARVMAASGIEPPAEDQLQAAALAGDLVTNTLYYGLVGLGKPSGAILRGAALGAAAGLGVLASSPVMGLGSRPSARTPRTAAMAFCWYLADGIASGVVYEKLV